MTARQNLYLAAKLNLSNGSNMSASNLEKSQRAIVVAQALRNVRARGIEPRTEVLALYAQYVCGTLGWKQVQDLMAQRIEALYASLCALKKIQLAASEKESVETG